MTYYLLIRPTFSSPFCLSLSCPRQQHSVSPAPLLCTVIHHQCHSVLPFHMAQHLFGSVAHAMLKGIQTNGAMRRLEAVSPLYVWCQLACQPKQNVYPVSWWISKAVQTFHCYLLFYFIFLHIWLFSQTHHRRKSTCNNVNEGLTEFRLSRAWHDHAYMYSSQGRGSSTFNWNAVFTSVIKYTCDFPAIKCKNKTKTTLTIKRWSK